MHGACNIKSPKWLTMRLPKKNESCVKNNTFLTNLLCHVLCHPLKKIYTIYGGENYRKKRAQTDKVIIYDISS